MVIDKNISVNENLEIFKYLLYNNIISISKFEEYYYYFLNKKKRKKFLYILKDYINTHKITNTLTQYKLLDGFDKNSNFPSVWFILSLDYSKNKLIFDINKELSNNTFKGVQFWEQYKARKYPFLNYTNFDNVHCNIYTTSYFDFISNKIFNSYFEFWGSHKYWEINGHNHYLIDEINIIKNSRIKYIGSTRYYTNLTINNIKFFDTNLIFDEMSTVKFYNCEFFKCRYKFIECKKVNFFYCKNTDQLDYDNKIT